MAQVRLGNPTLVIAGPFGVPETNTTFAAIDIPAGSFLPCYAVNVIITTLLDGGTPSIDVGDGDDDDGWVDTTEITETGAGTYGSVAAAYAVTGKYYSAADTIDVVLATGLTAGVF